VIAMLQTALALIRHGLAVFPCRPRTKWPACPHGSKDATLDPDVVKGWWAANPHANIAIATGETSKIFVLDADGLEGQEELGKLEARHGELPLTLQVVTASGMHHYFRWPGVLVRNSSSKVAPKIDVRGSGGYCLAPPSVHPSGRRYAWSVDSGDAIAAAPAWLIGLVADSGGNIAKPAEHWRNIVANGVDEGARDDTAAKLAGHLLRHYVDPVVAYELILCWNAQRCRPPLPARDIERVVMSVGKKEIERRESNGRT
jgi:hypothetical protein